MSCFFMKKSFYLVVFLLSFLSGVIVFKFFYPDFLSIIFIFLLFLALFFLFPGWKIYLVLSFIGFSLAFFRLNPGFSDKNQRHINFYNGKEVEIIGLVCEEPERKIDRQKIVLCTEKILFANSQEMVVGRVLVNLPLYPEFFYGDELQLSGKLKSPKTFTYINEFNQKIEFAYDKYLSRYKIFSLLSYPKKIKVLQKGKGNLIRGGLFSLKRKLIEKINISLPEPQAGFLAGLLWGTKSSIDPELLQSFNSTGTTHIIALSGFNITIIGVLMFLLAPWLFIKRQTAYWLVLITIILFVLFTGGQASVVRAAIMGVLALTAYYLGRPKAIFILLILAAALMVFVNPLVIFYDVGFQLSFLATVGLLYLAPKLEIYFLWLPNKLSMRESTVATLSAILSTLPLIAYDFKRVSLVAFFANILILPAIPIAMAVGFLFIIASFINFFIGKVLSVLVWFILAYIIFIVKIMARIPKAQMLIDISGITVIFLYFGLLLFVIYLYRFELRKLIWRRNKKFLNKEVNDKK